MSSSQHPLYPAIKFLTVTATKLYYGFLLAYLKLAPPKLPLPSSNTTGTTTTKAEDYHKYGFATLRAYDLALSWNCFLYGVSKTEMQQWFDQGLTEVHADIGPGSGYYPIHSKRLASLIASSKGRGPIQYHAFDTQETALLYLTSRMSSRFHLSSSSTNTSTSASAITTPGLTLSTHLFDARQHALARQDSGEKMHSVNMHFLLHCVPPSEGTGPERKFEEVLRTAWEMLKPGGKVCGTTILDPLALSTPTRANSAFSPSSLRLQPALALIAWLQSVGVLQNQGDSLHALLSAAERVGFEFDETSGEDVYLRGVVCFFRFRKPE